MIPSIKEQFLSYGKEAKIACASLIPSRVNLQLVIIHGFSEHMRYYYRAAELMAGKGAAVHLMDLPGHGLSSGSRGHIDSFQQYIDAVDFFINSRPGFIKEAPTFLLGHSMGGLISFHYYTQKRPDFRGLILSAPLAGFSRLSSGWLKVLARLVSLKKPDYPFPKKLAPWQLARDPGKWGQYFNDPYYLRSCSPRLFLEMNRMAEVSHKQARAFKAPLLIFSSIADRVISHQKVQSLWREVGSEDKTLAVFSQARHHLVQEKESECIVQKTLRWMKKRI